MSEPPRVLFVIGSLRPGGSETQLARLLTSLPAGSCRSALLISEDVHSDLRAAVDLAGVPVRVVDLPTTGSVALQMARSAVMLLRALRGARPDVVYVWLDGLSFYVAPLARLLGIPCVVARRNVVGARIEGRHPLIAKAVQQPERLATVVTANSRAVEDRAIERGIAPGRLRRVVNGHPSQEQSPFPADGPRVLGYLANLRPGKGHVHAIALVRALRDAGYGPEQLLLRFGGEGAERPTCEALVDEHGLRDLVEFVGQVDDAQAFWGACHVGVLLSDSEGMPNALLEAAFAGRPLLATDAGGTADVVVDGSDALVPVGDRDAVFRAARRLLDADADELRERGAAQYRHVEARFSIEVMVRQHLEAIDDALRTVPGGRC